jgi:hypothetical protein
MSISSELQRIEIEAKGLASTKTELAEKLKALEKPLTIEELQKILDTTVKSDTANKTITFLSMLLTYTDCEQLNLGFLAESSTGKSYIPLELSWYFPSEDVRKLGYVSPTAFFHDWGRIQTLETFEGAKEAKIFVDLANKILVFLDAPHPGLLEKLRPLLSHDEREIEVRITDRTQKYGMKTKTVIVRGFPTVVFCTANESLNEQEQTRMLLLSPEKTQEKLWEALLLKLERESDRQAFNRYMESEPSRCFLRGRVQAIKSANVKHIVIPEDLRKEILKRFMEGRKWLQPRHLRDVSRLLGLIKANALLNLWHRERQGDTIIANMEDVEAGFKLYQNVAEANELGVAPELLEIYKAIEADDKEDGYTIMEFQRLYMQVFHKPVGYDKARKMLATLASAGLLAEDVDSKDKRRTRYLQLGVRAKIHESSSLCAPTNTSNNVSSGKAEFKAETEKEPQNYRIEGAGKSPLFYSHPKSQISHGEPEASDGALMPLTPSESAEKCEVCGLRAVEWKVYFEGQWLKRCSSCLEKMKASGLKLHYERLTEGETNEA